MIDCLGLGDSIAVGIAAAIPGCLAEARVGIGSPAYAAIYAHHVSAELAIISLGSNDGGADTSAAMDEARSRVTAARVVWILPSTGSRAAAIAVAARYNDETVDVRPLVGRDRVHPRPGGYRVIARMIVGQPGTWATWPATASGRP